MRTFLFAAWVFVALSAQSQSSTTDPEKLQVQWEVIENNYQHKSQFLSAFTITNTNKQDWPATGWTLYFNFIRTVDPASVTGNVSIEHVNGDFFRLVPKSGFSGIKAGASLRVEFASSDWVVNFTDAPAGLYMVWDSNPAKGIELTHYTIKPSTEPKQYLRFAGDKIGLITPQMIFEQNLTARPVAAEKLIKIFPTPARYKEQSGSFSLTGDVAIVTDAAFRKEAELLAGDLQPVFHKKASITTAGNAKGIQLKKDETISEEGYTLSVKPDGIVIAASSGAGIVYGIQSLKSLLDPLAWAGTKIAIAVPLVDVEDAPRFKHRAFFLDVARNFQQKQQILKLLDLMVLYKLNVLHLHLNDDEGWRLEIPSLPELTSIGSKRGHSPDGTTALCPSFGSGPDVNNPHGSGYYSQEDYIEILRYATVRHIRVIPEIETPGHARAAVKSMDARYARLMKEGKKDEAEKYLLRDPEDQSVYRSVQGWNDNVINVAMPSTYTFLEKVVDEIMNLYQRAGAPLLTIHVGGDEVPAGVWERSPACKKLMRENPSLKSTEDLWYYFFSKVNSIVMKRGLSLYGWEEIAMRKTKLDGEARYIPNPDFVNSNFQVDVWNNMLGAGAEDLAYRLANAGYKVVLSCVTNLYFDMAYYKAFDEPGYYWGAFIDVDKPYYFIPYDYFKNAKEDKFGNALDRSIFIGKERLTDYGKSNIVGIQGALWAENMLGPERMEYMILPKMLGLAERAWAKDPAWATEKDAAKSEAQYQQAWSEFIATAGLRELPRLDHYAGGFQYRIPSPGAVIQDGKVVANMQYPGFTIRYTTDGKEPSLKSTIYSGPIAKKGTIHLKAFNARGRSGKTSTIVNP
ncbi:MAG TPA: family 20 glycosylhydrolase [Ohtaekwangia sp.]|uniref:family 20 glycosylhydrolase n=1 Tax=Ohtaekwangia sp. TaxID=2066019 RepID=UPI002F92FA57